MAKLSAWTPKNKKNFIRVYMSGATDEELAQVFGGRPDQIKKYLVRLRASKEVLARKKFTPTDASVKEASPCTEDIDAQELDFRILKRIKSQHGAVDTLEICRSFDITPKVVSEAVERLSSQNYLIKEIGGHLQFATPAPREHVVDTRNYSCESDLVFGVVSDNHAGSKYSNEKALAHAYEIFAEQGIETVYHAGNFLEGEARFNKNDIHVHGMGNQVQYFVDTYPQHEGVNTYFVAGDDHEGWWVQREGIDVGEYTQNVAEKAGRTDLHYLGYMEADIDVPTKAGGSTKIRVQHPGGGSSYATSYAGQKLVESLRNDELPDILILGHWHKYGYFRNRGVHVLLAGCFQEQTPFMRKKRLAAHLGASIVRVKRDDEGRITTWNLESIFFDGPEFREPWRYR